MAQDLNTVIAQMDTAQAAEPSLAPLNSSSATAIYSLFKRVIAIGMVQLSQLWDAAKKELNLIASSQIYGTKAWYVNLVLNMPGAVATKASCIELGSKVLIKVAKLSGTSTSNLTALEVKAVRDYVSIKKVVGTDLDVISQTADLVDITMSIQFVGVQSTVEAAVKQGIKDYLDALAFDVDLTKSLLTDYILTIPGVLNAYVDSMSVDYGLGYVLVTSNIAIADAGYFEVGKDISSNDLIILNMYQ